MICASPKCTYAWPQQGSAGSILEGLDEILTVIRLGLPHKLRRSLACTNIVENALGTVRQVSRNVKQWRNAKMALRWTAAGMMEAQKTFRRLKAYRQLPMPLLFSWGNGRDVSCVRAKNPFDRPEAQKFIKHGEPQRPLLSFQKNF